MMQVHVTEVEELETQRSALAQRITALVNADGNADEIAGFVREKSSLSARIAEAKAEQDRAEREQTANLQAQAREEFPQVLAECKAQRAALLEHVRGACLSWGSYRTLLDRLYGLTNRLSHPDVGPLPQFLNEARALELGDALQKSVCDLKSDMGGGWQLSFPVAPKYSKFQNER